MEWFWILVAIGVGLLFYALEKRINQRFDALEKRLDKIHDDLCRRVN